MSYENTWRFEDICLMSMNWFMEEIPCQTHLVSENINKTSFAKQTHLTSSNVLIKRHYYVKDV